MNSLANIFFIIFLIIDLKIQPSELVKRCKLCINSDDMTCEENQEDVSCTPENAEVVADALGNIFESIPHSKVRNQFDCFIIDLQMPGASEDEQFIHRIKNCIANDINACDLVPKKKLGLETKSCKQCKEDNCNAEYAVRKYSKVSNFRKNITGPSSNIYKPRKGRDNDDDRKRVSGIDTYATLFIAIVITAIIVCFFAWVIATKIC